MELKNFYAQDANGNILPGAACSLYLPGTTTLVTGLQDAAGKALANPFAADSTGLAAFAAPNGIYDLYMVIGTKTGTIRVQFIDVDQVSKDATSAAVSAKAAQDALTSGTSLIVVEAKARQAADTAITDGLKVMGWAGTAGSDTPTTDSTSRLSLPLPVSGNKLADDVGRLRSALSGFDSAAFLPGLNKSVGDVLRKAQSGTSIRIACYGDSITYGQDTSSDGQATQINGATQTRSRFPFPDCLNESLGLTGILRTVVNYGYPGDTSAKGLERWANTDASDLVFIMYGHNDAVGYGGLPLQTVAQFRTNIRTFVERERNKGAAVVLIAPPQVKDQGQNNTIRPYAYAVRQIGAEYGIPVVDAQEQLLPIPSDKYWTDGVHLTTYAYNELGWHLATLVARRDGAAIRVSSGTQLYAAEFPGYGGSMVDSAAARGGQLVKIDAGLTYAVGVYCDEDVRMAVTSYNASSDTTALAVYYSGSKSAYRGTQAASLSHVSSRGVRQTVTSQVLKKGYRTLYIRNEGTVAAYIEAIRCVSAEQPVFGGGLFSKSVALSSLFCPNNWPFSDWVSVADHANRMKAPCSMRSWVTLPDAGLAGIALWSEVAAQNEFLGDLLWVLRNGANVEVRQMVSGTLTSLGSASAFTSGSTWTGELVLQLDDSGLLNVIVDGTTKLSGITPPFTIGCPGLLGAKASKWVSHSVLLNGLVKAVY